jgi:hypothetical protein
MLLPVLAIKILDLHVFKGRWINTAKVDADAIRIGAWRVKGFNSAIPTEVVLRNTRIKSVDRKILPGSQQIKSRAGNDKMQKACSIADGTVTSMQKNIRL